MKRVAIGFGFVVLGVICCGAGLLTLLPVVMADGKAICGAEFSLSIAWPGLILLIFLIAYCNKIGREFWWNS
jgi:hypothetical protein